MEEQERLDDAASAAIAKKNGRGAASRKGRKVPVKSQDIKSSFEKKTKEPSKAALKKVKKDFGFDSDSVKSEESRTANIAAATASDSLETVEVDEVAEPLSLADRLKKSMSTFSSLLFTLREEFLVWRFLRNILLENLFLSFLLTN